MKERELYSIKEAREFLGGISRNTLYGLLHRGELGSVVIGNRRFISRTAISDLISKASTQQNPAEDPVQFRESNGDAPPPTHMNPIRLSPRKRKT
jgi:excisionase family DNA binding protein